DFQSAKGIFSALCLYDQVNPKYWICLANCLEHLDLYKEAADCYRLLCLVTKGVDPMPYLCLGYCCLQINDKANAQEALELGRELRESAQNEDRQLVEQFDKLLNLC
ncbi:MAG: hypothetical protein K6F05_02275, partial [Succinivibrio sp.]|nr:hypothetical protein [Succinivibrio sp.]